MYVHRNTSPSSTKLACDRLPVQALLYFPFNWQTGLFNLLLSLVIVALVLYLVGYYLLVTRIVEGVTEPAYGKIKSGVAGDPVAAVSDLAAAGARMSLTVPDPTALHASSHYWLSIANPGGTAKLV
ncbi:MAG: hypothetical protein HC767_00965 [Akkermansiaceae bacterium]|nr:hypothetical protein [Akkermansiaceae bacterium]